MKCGFWCLSNPNDFSLYPLCIPPILDNYSSFGTKTHPMSNLNTCVVLTHTHTLSYKSYVCTYLHLRRNKKIQDIIYSYRTKVCYLHSFFQFLFLSLCCICVDNCCHLNEPSIRPWNEPSFPVGFSEFLPSDTNVLFCMSMYVYV